MLYLRGCFEKFNVTRLLPKFLSPLFFLILSLLFLFFILPLNLLPYQFIRESAKSETERMEKIKTTKVLFLSISLSSSRSFHIQIKV